MERVAGLIVTYNRKDLLIKTIESLISQTYPLERLYIVNNGSTDGTYEVLAKYSNEKIKVLNLNENRGGAGGFKAGMKWIICEGKYDWIWMMDDDAIPMKNALENLMSYYESLSEQARKKIGVLENQRVWDKEWFEGVKNKRVSLSAKRDLVGRFVGYLVKTSVVERVGFPREDFFIYVDDVEYTFRIRKAGFKVLIIDGSYIYHPTWETGIWRYIFNKRKLIKRGIIRISPWRMYYMFRNPLLMFENRPIIKILIFLAYYLDALSWRTIDNLSYQFALKGLKDGIKGISGKRVNPGQQKL